jgi:hypothetical protein
MFPQIYNVPEFALCFFFFNPDNRNLLDFTFTTLSGKLKETLTLFLYV